MTESFRTGGDGSQHPVEGQVTEGVDANLARDLVQREVGRDQLLSVGRVDLSGLAAYPVLVNVLTFGGLGIELCLAFLLWVRPARPWVIRSRPAAAVARALA